MIPFIWDNKIVKFKVRESKMIVAKRWMKGETRVVFDGYRVSVFQDVKILEMCSGDGYKTVWMY